MAITHLTTATFNDTLKGESKMAIVDFYADWCMPCKMIAPILEEIDREGQVAIYKINIDENPEIAVQYGIQSIPTLISFQNGQVFKRGLGAQPKSSILALVQPD